MTEERSTGKTFGARLRAEREAREISLEEIARVTKISIHLLHAMENDDWAALPGGIFTRNFIRLYANHLGLDAERWVEEFKHYGKARKGGEEEKEKEKEVRSEVTERPASTEPPQGWLYVLLIVTIALLVGGYFVISYLRGSSDTPDSGLTPEEQTAPAEATSAAIPLNPDRAGVIEEPKLEPAAALTVTLTETGTRQCWVMIWADSELVSPAEGENLAPGTPRLITADQSVRLNIARIGSIELLVNGAKTEWSSYRPEARTDAAGNTVSYVVNITAPSTP